MFDYSSRPPTFLSSPYHHLHHHYPSYQDRLHPYLRSKYFNQAPLSAAFDPATVQKMNNVSMSVYGQTLGDGRRNVSHKQLQSINHMYSRAPTS